MHNSIIIFIRSYILGFEYYNLNDLVYKQHWFCHNIVFNRNNYYPWNYALYVDDKGLTYVHVFQWCMTWGLHRR